MRLRIFIFRYLFEIPNLFGNFRIGQIYTAIFDYIVSKSFGKRFL